MQSTIHSRKETRRRSHSVYCLHFLFFVYFVFSSRTLSPSFLSRRKLHAKLISTFKRSRSQVHPVSRTFPFFLYLRLLFLRSNACPFLTLPTPFSRTHFSSQDSYFHALSSPVYLFLLLPSICFLPTFVLHLPTPCTPFLTPRRSESRNPDCYSRG